MKLKPRSINGSSWAVLLGAVTISAVCSDFIPSASAQNNMPNIHLVDYVSLSPLSPSREQCPTAPTNSPPVTEARTRELGCLIKPTCTTPGDRWTVFESEYGIHEASPSPIGRMLQAAKYGLDRMTFTAQETAKRCEFTYDFGDVPATDLVSQGGTSQSSLPMFGRFGNAQFRSEVTIHDPQTGQAFIGLKLAIPFGQGG